MPKLSLSFCLKSRSVPFLQTKRSLILRFSARDRDRPNRGLARAKNWHTNKCSVCTSLEFWLFYYILLNEVLFLPKLSLSFCLKSRSVPFLQIKRSLILLFSARVRDRPPPTTSENISLRYIFSQTHEPIRPVKARFAQGLDSLVFRGCINP